MKGLAPKPANLYREVLAKLVHWAMESGPVKTPLDRNPMARVGRYGEQAPEIRYLMLEQIDEQLEVLRGEPQLRVMVAPLIYAGLRCEELPWLQVEELVRLSARSPNGLLRVQAKTIDGESWQPTTKNNRAVTGSRDLQALGRVRSAGEQRRLFSP